ncbi:MULTISPECIES: hypothetical protein [Mesobacillus]|uniref:Uncharacterized protein n=2 Tax=Mesobacillus TaxID=2675231 RepID=A0A0D6ZAV2_9BACI|nr:MULTISPECIES: hypothetical protein [Mesobacillus]KIY22642.1 hypothetical protein UB32_07425 [Mesobacillus subterraneus]MDQ0411930.1 hypothetical protein [Mesobacillus stamsii]
MKMYEAILAILQKKGTATIPIICEEMNEQALQLAQDRTRLLEASYIKTVISRNTELFVLNDDTVSIRPDKEPMLLIVELHGYPGPEQRVRIDFTRNTFTYFEWHLDSRAPGPIKTESFGSVGELKKKLYSVKLWDWQDDYHTEGIIVDGTSWSVTLKTKGKTYKSKGHEAFPKEWHELCRAISKLIGIKFSC